MLPEPEVKVETSDLAEGGISLRLTHLPTGVFVFGDLSEKPYRSRLMELHEQLERLVKESHE